MSLSSKQFKKAIINFEFDFPKPCIKVLAYIILSQHLNHLSMLILLFLLILFNIMNLLDIMNLSNIIILLNNMNHLQNKATVN